MDLRGQSLFEVAKDAHGKSQQRASVSGQLPGIDTKSINHMPDKILLHVFSYLKHKELCHIASGCKKWRMIANDSCLWF
ncbi:hypothetical protein LSH36_495g01011 [Paralvinella palmiformis]|uniref:F-box domain-containing protein n=1 Tax=Paralvinella palmiformis TaxID=53620 RepID=A0AAD9MY44_9ANNE|nr:hypothetical protein LSH36_495g01011 [Paralvinella palmiformis]